MEKTIRQFLMWKTQTHSNVTCLELQVGGSECVVECVDLQQPHTAGVLRVYEQPAWQPCPQIVPNKYITVQYSTVQYSTVQYCTVVPVLYGE